MTAIPERCPHCETPLDEGEECQCDGAEIQQLKDTCRFVLKALKQWKKSRGVWNECRERLEQAVAE